MNRKKNLLVFHPALAPYRIDFFNALNEFFDANFYFFNTNLLSQKFDQDKLYEEVNFEPKFLKKGTNLFNHYIRFGIKNLIETYKPDIVITPEYNLVNYLLLFHRIKEKKKYSIYSLCDDSIQVAENSSLLRKIARYILVDRLDGIILTNNNVRNWYENNLSPNAKLLVFPLIRNEKTYLSKLQGCESLSRKYSERYKLDRKSILLYVGRLAPEKNLTTLLKAFKKVVEIKKDCVLIIVGSGSQESNLEREIVKSKLSDFVKMVGRFEGEELLAWYKIADIFVLPSSWEAFGAVINEALLAGCYTLVSKNAGGSSLIKKGENGDTFAANDIEELKNLILNAVAKNKYLTKNKKENRSLMPVTFETSLNRLIDEIV